MQSLNINLTPANPSMQIGAEASGLWYESGNSALNTRIIVSPEVGGDIELKPGQRVKMTQMSKSWRVRSLDPAATIVGKILIGSGEFEDNSSLVTLDASFANNVTIMNASVPVTISGGDVEIKNDAGNPIPATITNTPSVNVANTPAVTISGTATVQENLISINGGVTHANINSGFATTLFTSAGNLNGAIIQSAQGTFSNTAALTGVVMIAKQGGDPASITDGIMIAGGILGASKDGVFELRQKIRIPAGYGVKIYNGAANLAACQAGATFTLL